jgi:hypothetical protein
MERWNQSQEWALFAQMVPIADSLILHRERVLSGLVKYRATYQMQSDTRLAPYNFPRL